MFTAIEFTAMVDTKLARQSSLIQVFGDYVTCNCTCSHRPHFHATAHASTTMWCRFSQSPRSSSRPDDTSRRQPWRRPAHSRSVQVRLVHKTYTECLAAGGGRHGKRSTHLLSWGNDHDREHRNWLRPCSRINFVVGSVIHNGQVCQTHVWNLDTTDVCP